MNWFKKRPWLWVVVAFVLLISAWTVLITLALNNQPETIDIHQEETPAETQPAPPQP